jgi:hypothetical protein
VSGDYYFSKIYNRWKETSVGAGGGVTLDHAAVVGRLFGLMALQCSGDAAALVTIESPAGTVKFRKRFAAAFNFSETFPLGTVEGLTGDVLRLKISASTSNCEANFQGYDRKAAK